MSSSAAPTSAPSASASQVLLANGLPGTPANGAAATPGLFLNVLSMLGLGDPSPAGLGGDGASQGTNLAVFGASGFNFDPALLVLPTGVANLSEENLQNFLSTQAGTAGPTLNAQILQALTAGTPQTPDFQPLTASCVSNNATAVNAGTSVTGALALQNPVLISTQEGNNSNVATPSADITQASPLLIATGLSPAQIQQMKDKLAAANNADQKARESKDANLALVSLVPVPIQNTPLQQTATDLVIGQDMPIDLSVDDKILSLPAVTDLPLSKGPHNKPLCPFEIAQLATKAAQGQNEGMISQDYSALAHPANIDSAGNVTTASAGIIDAKASTTMLSGHSQFLATPSDLTSSMLTLMGLDSGTIAQSNLASPLLNNASSTSAHPATHMVAMMIQKANDDGVNKAQILNIQLDPPELGRVQVQLSYEKGSALKVHLVAESKDTMNILQRDSHALKAALDQAGIQTDGSSLTFDMSGGNQSFNQLLGRSHDGHKGGHSSFAAGTSTDISEGAGVVMEMHMNDIPDFANGAIRYSFLA